MQSNQRPPPRRGQGVALAVWLSRPHFLAAAGARTVGWRYARDGPGFLLSTAIVGVWAGLTGSAVVGWVLALTTAAALVHAALPARDAHSYYLGDGAVGRLLGSQRVGRPVGCLLWMLAGLWCEAEGDFGARNYFLASGAAGLCVIAAARRIEAEQRADLRDAGIVARGRVGDF